MSGFSGGANSDPNLYLIHRAACMGYDLQIGPDAVAVKFDDEHNTVEVITEQPARQIVTENGKPSSNAKKSLNPADSF